MMWKNVTCNLCICHSNGTPDDTADESRCNDISKCSCGRFVCICCWDTIETYCKNCKDVDSCPDCWPSKRCTMCGYCLKQCHDVCQYCEDRICPNVDKVEVEIDDTGHAHRNCAIQHVRSNNPVIDEYITTLERRLNIEFSLL